MFLGWQFGAHVEGSPAGVVLWPPRSAGEGPGELLGGHKCGRAITVVHVIGSLDASGNALV